MTGASNDQHVEPASVGVCLGWRERRPYLEIQVHPGAADKEQLEAAVRAIMASFTPSLVRGAVHSVGAAANDDERRGA